MTKTDARHNVEVSWGGYERTIRDWMEKTRKLSMIRRLWDKDASLWTLDPAGQKEAASRLGWLEIAKTMKGSAVELASFAEGIRAEGFSHALLLGMGGSSLAPQVFQSVFGQKAGCPELLVLDSTDPDQVREVEKKIEIGKTLFIVSSKSGGTVELISFFNYFFEKLKNLCGDKAGEQFIAITDPGTPLEALAAKNNFKKVFLAPSDVGGRFSALTYFGLVPAALIGADLEKVLESARDMMEMTSPQNAPDENAALPLGVGMAVLAEEGRDKLTFLCAEGLESFADWAEQLVAESTGKEEFGIIPVVREAPGAADVYGSDRFVVALSWDSKEDAPFQKTRQTLKEAGHPVISFRLKEKSDLGAEFFRWEMATAIACALLKVNAFDQPDVQAAKDRTKAILKKGELGEKVSAPRRAADLGSFWHELQAGDYVGILAFLPDRDILRQGLLKLQTSVRDLTGKATTLGFGPRYLHSTGQLHKGGPNTGTFILITAKHTEDLAIPGAPYGFRGLELAQAIGDLEALEERHRRVIHFELESPSEKELNALVSTIVGSIPARD